MSNLPSEVTQDGRNFALIAYASGFTGLPLFLIPLAMRKDDFSIHHAKQAAEIYLISIGWVAMLSFAYFAFSLITFGLGSLLGLCCLPLYALPVVSTIHGLILALNNEWRAPLGVFGIADSLLSSVRAEK